jgi:hypothetical protein
MYTYLTHAGVIRVVHVVVDAIVWSDQYQKKVNFTGTYGSSPPPGHVSRPVGQPEAAEASAGVSLT